MRKIYPKPEERHPRSTARGFSLPELLITILLISVLFTLMLIFSSSLRSTRKVRDYEIAIALAQQAVEILRAAPFDTLDDADFGKNSVEADFNTDTGKNDMLKPEMMSGKVKYLRTVEVSEMPSLSKGARMFLKHVKVTVKWKSPEEGDIPPYVITTAIADLN